MHTHNLYPPSSSLQGSHLNIHLLQVRRNLKLRLSLTPHLLNANPLSNLLQRQSLDPIAIENRQIRNNRRHALLPRERERALLEDLGVALLVHVLHGDDDLGLRRVGDEIHGAPDTLDFAGEHEVGEVAELVDLHGAQHGDVDAPGADHAEGFVGAEGRGAADEGDGFFARVDQVGVPSDCVSWGFLLGAFEGGLWTYSSPGLGYRPIPRMPFSDSSTISVPSGRKAGAARGMPMPRLTYMPSLSSWAARLMMRSRFCEASEEPGDC